MKTTIRYAVQFVAMLVIAFTVVTAPAAEMSDAKVAETLLKVAATSKAQATYRRAAAVYTGHGTLSESDRKILLQERASFEKRNPAVAVAIDKLIAKTTVQVRQATVPRQSGSQSAAQEAPLVDLEGSDALDIGTPKPMTVTLVKANRAQSIIDVQIDKVIKGVAGKPATGSEEHRENAAQILLKALQAASAVLQGKQADGDLVAYAAVLRRSAQYADTDAKSKGLKQLDKEVAGQIAASYRVGAAALGGVLTIEGLAAPSNASTSPSTAGIEALLAENQRDAAATPPAIVPTPNAPAASTPVEAPTFKPLD